MILVSTVSYVDDYNVRFKKDIKLESYYTTELNSKGKTF